jgi:hypothetical protein
MKHCSTCNQTYDDTQSFCLMDGTPLTTDSEEKTVVMQSPTRKKSKIPLVLGLLCLLVLAGSGLMAWLLFNNYSRQTKNVRDNQKTEVNVKSSSALPSTPMPASTVNSLVEESSPKEDELKETSDNEDSENVTPIAWDTTPGGFKGEAGQTYTFRCPEEGTAQAIFGSDVYADYSSICTAAVHVGLINLIRGGVVTLEFRPGRSIYGSTTRYGIKSNTAGTHTRSFVVR